MSQAAFLRQFDAMAFGAFANAGLADAARYLTPAQVQVLAQIAAHDPDSPDEPPAAPAPVACTVLVDHNVEDFGDDAAPVSVYRTRITFQRAELVPEQGGQVSILDSADAVTGVYVLVQRTGRNDESASAWWVQEVPHG